MGLMYVALMALLFVAVVWAGAWFLTWLATPKRKG